MKVRCIDDYDIDIGQITNGKVYDVLKEGGLGYLIIDDLNIRKYLRKDRFEIVKEENKMEKTFREVIADIKEGEMLSEAHFRFTRTESSLDAALKAYEEGKELQSCENGYKYLQNTFTYPGNEQWLCFRNSEQMFTTDAIRGKWYIND